MFSHHLLEEFKKIGKALCIGTAVIASCALVGAVAGVAIGAGIGLATTHVASMATAGLSTGGLIGVSVGIGAAREALKDIIAGSWKPHVPQALAAHMGRLATNSI